MPVNHPWDLTPGQARKLQTELAALVVTTTPVAKWDVIACADISMGRYDKDLAAAVVVVGRVYSVQGRRASLRG